MLGETENSQNEVSENQIFKSTFILKNISIAFYQLNSITILDLVKHLSVTEILNHISSFEIQ